MTKKILEKIELKNGVIIDLSKNGQIIGFEIPNAKKYFQEKQKKFFKQQLKQHRFLIHAMKVYS